MIKRTKKVLYGPNTERAKKTFSICGKPLPLELFYAIAQIKIAAATANKELKLLSAKKHQAIVRAAQEIIDGKLDDQFVIDAFQSGAGTPTHMNVNEVIANRGLELLKKKKGDYSVIHPNNDVNMGQSTNNVMPTAIKIVAVQKLKILIPILEQFEKSLKKKATEFKHILKSGRTHLQDAVPITLGQEFNAYATAMNKNVQRLKTATKSLYELSIGKNAVGTGINTYPEFTKTTIKHLKKMHEIPWIEAKDAIFSTNNLTVLLETSQALKLLAVDLTKMANDLKLMNSGPTAGLAEIKLPVNEAGSSIMPGKANPNIAEMINMVCFQIMGNNETISLSAQAGQLDLNVMMPVIAHNLVESMKIAINGVSTFDKKCIRGIKANKENCKHYFERSVGMATLLNPYIGYDKATEVVKESLKTGKSIKDIVLAKKLISAKKLDEILDYRKVTKPNLSKK